MQDNQYFKLYKFPFQRAINIYNKPFMDINGDIFQYCEGEFELIMKSQLRKEYDLNDLNDRTAKLLFSLIRNEFKKIKDLKNDY